MIASLLLGASLLLSQPSLNIDETFEQKIISVEALVYAASDQIGAGEARALHEQDKFSSPPAKGMVYPAKPKYYWIQFAVENHSQKAKTVFVEIRNAHLNNVQLFNYVQGSKEIHASELTGDHLPYSSREINHRFFVFQATLEAGEKREFLLSADKYNESIKLPILLRAENNFYGNAAAETTAIGLFVGVYCVVIACLTIFCIVSFGALRVSLLVYVVGISLSVVSNTGLGMQFLWGDIPLLNSLSRSLFSSIGVMALLVFTYYYFDMPQRASSRLSQTHRLVTVCFAILWLLFDLYYYWVAVESPLAQFVAIGVVQACMIFLPVYLISLSLYFVIFHYRHKNILFLLSNAGVMVAMIFFSLEELGLAKDIFLTEIVMLTSLLLDFSTLASIVALDFYRIRTDNEKLSSSLDRAILDGAKSFLEGQQIERKRLAIEIHDGASVRLAAVQMRLSGLDTPQVHVRDELLKEVKVISQDIRNFSHNLSSVVLEEYGFVIALEELILSLEDGNSPFQFEFNYGRDKIDSKNTERELYFICLELINNALKHSSGDTVKILLSASPEGYELKVQDNGVGYAVDDKKAVGLGLKGIDWRLKILSGELEALYLNGLQTHTVRIPRC